MAKKVDEMLIEVLAKYGEDANKALWDCHGTWVAYHKAIERVAAKAGIVFDMPQIIEANSASKTVAIAVSGRMGDRMEWSFGEATPANNKNAYPYAMAEKRAKDRVVLKLVGLAGFVYSEEESDDFKQTGNVDQPDPAKPASKAPSRDGYTRLEQSMRANRTADDLIRWWNDPECIAERDKLPPDWKVNLQTDYRTLGTQLRAKETKADNSAVQNMMAGE